MELKKVNKKLDAVCDYIHKHRKNENLFQFPIDIEKDLVEFEKKAVLAKPKQQLVTITLSNFKDEGSSDNIQKKFKS